MILYLLSWVKISKSLLHGLECSWSIFYLLQLSISLYSTPVSHSMVLFPSFPLKTPFFGFLLLIYTCIMYTCTHKYGS